MKNLFKLFVCLIAGHSINLNFFRHPKSYYKSAPYVCHRCWKYFDDEDGRIERTKK